MNWIFGLLDSPHLEKKVFNLFSQINVNRPSKVKMNAQNILNYNVSNNLFILLKLSRIILAYW